MPDRLTGDRFRHRIERQELQAVGQQIGGSGQLFGLFGPGNDHDPRPAVANLLGDLRSGERVVNRHMDAAGKMNGQIADDPLVAILADQQQPIAGPQTDGAQAGRPAVGRRPEFRSR